MPALQRASIPDLPHLGAPRWGFSCAYPCRGATQNVKGQASKNGASADEYEDIAE
jgi:hypothetical protein